ncbi:formyl peptide receptor-related sequence 4-like [Dromiciops gliroides]|uniref:formyl peptide receptor-related sequence 4-like n=1 Tax=Dromiciops gliroides TaxID=33562 RepID=UPI001CC45F67|nr:formyl peptide receptor-related sequence 4-like [Dromiciops gliroides]
METASPAPANSSEIPSDPLAGAKFALHMLFLIILSATSILGMIGNGLVIWVTSFRMPQNITKIWFLNLAVADFTFTAFLPIKVATLALGHWPLGQLACKLYHTLSMLNMFASVFLLTLVSVDRCLCILQPLLARNHRTQCRVTLVAIGAWVLALGFSGPYLVYRETHTDPVTGLTYCYNNYNAWPEVTENWMEQIERVMRRYRIQVTVNFVAGFAGPLLIICGCSGLSVAKLKAGRQSMRSNRPFQVLIAVVMAFFCCWFPLHLVTIWELIANLKNTQGHGLLAYLSMPAFILASANSCLNPILYSFIGKNFRQHLLCSMTSVLQQALEEDSKTGRTARNTTSELQEIRPLGP